MARLFFLDAAGMEQAVDLGPDAPEVAIGRTRECQVRTQDTTVSRVHCHVRFENGRYVARDNGSSNGMYFQGERTGEVWLVDGAEFYCGHFRIKLQLDAHELAAVGQVELSADPPTPLEQDYRDATDLADGPVSVGRGASLGAPGADGHSTHRYGQDLDAARREDTSQGFFAKAEHDTRDIAVAPRSTASVEFPAEALPETVGALEEARRLLAQRCEELEAAVAERDHQLQTLQNTLDALHEADQSHLGALRSLEEQLSAARSTAATAGPEAREQQAWRAKAEVLREENDNLGERVASLEHELGAAQTRLSVARAEATSRADALHRAEQHADLQQRETDQVRRRLEAELSHVHGLLDEAESKLVDAPDLNDLEELRRDLVLSQRRADEAELELRHAIDKATEKTTADAKRTIDEQARLAAADQEAWRSKWQTESDRADAARHELEAAQAALDQAQERAQQSERRATTLEGRAAAAEAKAVAAETRAAAAEAKTTNAEQATGEASTQLAEARELAQLSDSAAEDLREQLRGVQQALQAAQAKAAAAAADAATAHSEQAQELERVAAERERYARSHKEQVVEIGRLLDEVQALKQTAAAPPASPATPATQPMTVQVDAGAEQALRAQVREVYLNLNGLVTTFRDDLEILREQMSEAGSGGAVDEAVLLCDSGARQIKEVVGRLRKLAGA